MEQQEQTDRQTQQTWEGEDKRVNTDWHGLMVLIIFIDFRKSIVAVGPPGLTCSPWHIADVRRNVQTAFVLWAFIDKDGLYQDESLS